MTRILIVDDEPMIIDVLKAYFERAGYTVYTAFNGADALRMFEQVNPEFLILDLMLPDFSGEEVCKRVRETSDIPIMMLTAKTQEEERINGIVIGADDYLTKPFSPREVVVRVKAILRRTKKEMKRDLLSFNHKDLVIDLLAKEAIVKGIPITLTPFEFKLLVALAEFPGRVYSRLDLLEKVQNESFEGYERSVDVHIKNLRKKVELDTKNPEYIITVFGMGYKYGGKRDVSNSSI
ncbi:DNA-binding response regulator [Anaerobacillus alkalidiazotrophicus]|uniref:DNA-binding response regulator n=1 Tax=Anaerobacillus alkalidiazotrophicus TaxID=472963 RepID=A0A1S2M2Z5_9BACI|nr:response regulator transcription factor [Anaerobacillus alkalidiazotrophicus]OIJ18900.1 DNA-binding response regulator [Anaerobacillus alkalidiazotrophicus]